MVKSLECFSLSALSSNQPTLEDVPNSSLISLSLSKRLLKKVSLILVPASGSFSMALPQERRSGKPLASARLHSKACLSQSLILVFFQAL
jgi:hypothetical protein